jgi:hypothetical protein
MLYLWTALRNLQFAACNCARDRHGRTYYIPERTSTVEYSVAVTVILRMVQVGIRHLT